MKTTINVQYHATPLCSPEAAHEGSHTKKQPDIIGKWKLDLNNMQPHVTHSITAFPAKKKKMSKWYPIWSTVQIWRLDFFLYPILKKKLKWKHFQTGMATVEALEAILHMAKGGL